MYAMHKYFYGFYTDILIILILIVLTSVNQPIHIIRNLGVGECPSKENLVGQSTYFAFS